MWSILYDLVQNAALLSLVLLPYVAWPKSTGWGDRLRDRAVLGAVLGGASVLVMFASIEVAPGVIFDVRAAPIIVAGMLGGWPATLLAAVPAMAARAWLGGSGMMIGLLALLVYATGGALVHELLRRSGRRIGLWTGIATTVALSLIALTTLFLLPDRELGTRLLRQLGPILIFGNLLGVALVGSILLLERRRRELLDNLRASEIAARAALETRSRFIAGMSHEIRTPLNSVIGYAQLLSDESLTEPGRLRLRRLSAAAASLLGLLDDILDYAKIQAGHLSVAARPTDVAARMQHCVDMLEHLSAESGVPVFLTVAADVPDRLAIDGDRLVQIVSNALKFTREGRVDISLGYDRFGETLVLRISDTGVGMAGEDLERIFQPFERLQKAFTPGTGLGLTVVSTIVRSMQGRIDVASVPGEGSVFTVRLPCHPVEAGSDAAVRTLAAKSDRDVAAASAVGDDEPLAGLSILVVDDTAMNADILEAMLRRAGCAVDLATNGREAVAAVQARAFDLVLMDIRMPEMDGYAATRAIRALERENGRDRLPIVALTAHVSRADARACAEAGMDGFLTKPLDRAVLLRNIAEICRGGGVLAAPAEPVSAVSPGGASSDSRGIDEEPLLDRQRLEQLEQFMEPAQITGLLSGAATVIDAEAARMTEGGLPSDAQQVFHRLISVAGNAGLLRLSALCRLLEGRMMQGQDVQEDLLARFFSLAADSTAALRAFVSGDQDIAEPEPEE